MKTLDEVIDNFEKACDLERRCEGCSGCLGQENGCPNDGAESVPDALHYLKVLKDILDPLKVKKITHEITCPQCKSVIAILLPESNDPLTWQELQTMEGKPVWIEVLDDNGDHYKWRGDGWYIVKDFTQGYYGRYCHLEPSWRTWTESTYGDLWQAYLKERKPTGGSLIPEPKSKKLGEDTEIKWSEKMVHGKHIERKRNENA